MERKRGKIDGKALAANATLAFSGLVGENFHHRLFFFFAATSAKAISNHVIMVASGNSDYINDGGRALLWHQEPDQPY